jgi:hypothetical protein
VAQRAKEQEILEHMESLRQENETFKKDEVARRHAEFESEIEEIRNNPPELDWKWTAELLALWDDEQRYAKARDYDAVRIVHVKAEAQKELEIEKHEARQRLKRDHLIEQRKAEHARDIRVLEDRLDLLGAQKLHPSEQELQKVRTTMRSIECDLHALHQAK